MELPFIAIVAAASWTIEGAVVVGGGDSEQLVNDTYIMWYRLIDQSCSSHGYPVLVPPDYITPKLSISLLRQ